MGTTVLRRPPEQSLALPSAATMNGDPQLRREKLMDSIKTSSEATKPSQPDPSDAAMRSSAHDSESSAATSALTEDQALAVLQRQDLPAESIEQLTQNASVMKSRKVRIAVAAHLRSPRHISLRLIREFYTFDLVQFTLLPAVAADLKRAADEALIRRMASITLGERIALARRASTTVAAALLLDKESRVWQTALENSRLTEATVVKTLLRSDVPPALVEAVSHHPKWSLRHEVRIALLRNAKTPMARALEFARTLPPPLLRDVLHTSHLPEKVKTYLRKQLELEK